MHAAAHNKACFSSKPRSKIKLNKVWSKIESTEVRRTDWPIDSDTAKLPSLKFSPPQSGLALYWVVSSGVFRQSSVQE
jgi:hypothetical protein